MRLLWLTALLSGFFVSTSYAAQVYQPPMGNLPITGTTASSFSIAGGATLGNLGGVLLLTPTSTHGVDLVTSGSKATCEAVSRGQLFFQAGGAGAQDVLYLCEKNAADAYAWKALNVLN